MFQRAHLFLFRLRESRAQVPGAPALSQSMFTDSKPDFLYVAADPVRFGAMCINVMISIAMHACALSLSLSRIHTHTYTHTHTHTQSLFCSPCFIAELALAGSRLRSTHPASLFPRDRVSECGDRMRDDPLVGSFTCWIPRPPRRCSCRIKPKSRSMRCCWMC